MSADQRQLGESRKVTVYISSTIRDLRKHRAELLRQLRLLSDVHVVAMENSVARDDQPKEACLADVAKCDVYVGIFALRYGFVPSVNNPSGYSITELEYRQAVAMGRQCLIFLLSSDYRWPAERKDSVTGENGKGERIRQLREELRVRHLASEFTSPNDLASKVVAAVSNWRSSRSQVHHERRWVRGLCAGLIVIVMAGWLLLHKLNSIQSRLNEFAEGAARKAGVSAEALLPQLNHQRLVKAYPYGYVIFASNNKEMAHFNPYPKEIDLDSSMAKSVPEGSAAIRFFVPDVKINFTKGGNRKCTIMNSQVVVSRSFLGSVPAPGPFDDHRPRIEVVAVGESGVIWVYGIARADPVQ